MGDKTKKLRVRRLGIEVHEAAQAGVIGFTKKRGRKFEAFDTDGRSLGIFATLTAAGKAQADAALKKRIN